MYEVLYEGMSWRITRESALTAAHRQGRGDAGAGPDVAARDAGAGSAVRREAGAETAVEAGAGWRCCVGRLRRAVGGGGPLEHRGRRQFEYVLAPLE